MALKWSMESAWAAIAVMFSIGGGAYTTVYHSGASAAQILELQKTQADTTAHVAKHDEQLSTIQQTQAAQNQKLQDIADTVHDMRDNGVKRK